MAHKLDINKMTPTQISIYESAADKLVKCMIAGINEFDIKDLFRRGKITETARNFSTDEISFVIDMAQEELKQIRNRDNDLLYSTTVAQLEDLYMHARSESDYKTCADILMKKAKIVGLGETNKQEIVSSGNVEIVHKYNNLGDRDDVTLNMEEFGNEPSPFPLS